MYKKKFVAVYTFRRYIHLKYDCSVAGQMGEILESVKQFPPDEFVKNK